MKIRIFFSLLLLLVSQELFAASLSSEVHAFQLSNGMRWLLVYRPQVPVFSGIVLVRAGGVDESKGKTGIAHMFEHMAFKGSKEVGARDFEREKVFLNQIALLGQEMVEETKKNNPDARKIANLKSKIFALSQETDPYQVKNEIWLTLTQKGSVDLNAFTTKDMTAYHASMPSVHFPLWAYLNSEMILGPIMREFYQERDVVMEERRLRYDNSPEGFLFESLLKEAFPGGVYESAPIGYPEDLLTLTMEDAYEFHQKFYVPQNMVGVIVGSISLEQARSISERFFGKFPSKEIPKEEKEPSFAFQGEKRKEISFPAEPKLLIAFHKPKAPAREDYVFDVLDTLFCEGRTGRFYQKLVKEKKVATQVDCASSFPGSRKDNLFLILANPAKGTSLNLLEESIFQEIENLKQDLQEGELLKVRRNVLYNYYWGLEDNLHLAEQLAVAQAVIGDWRYVSSYPKVLETVMSEEVKKVAQKYLVASNRIVVHRKRGKKQ